MVVFAVSGVPSWMVGCAATVVVVACGTVVTVVTVAVSPPDPVLAVDNPSPGSIASNTAPVMTASTMMTKPRVFWNHWSTALSLGTGRPVCPLPVAQGAPERAVAPELQAGRDVARLVQRPVVLGQVTHRHAGVDVVREVPADVEGHEEGARPPRLPHRVRRRAPVAGGVHAAVLGDGTEPIDHAPHG